MLRKILTATLLGLAPVTALFAAGCASNGDKPYALTGNSSTISDEERKEQRRWTDSKGRYRPDLRMGGGRPLNYIP